MPQHIREKDFLGKPSDGYLIAKREMQAMLDNTLMALKGLANKSRKEGNYAGLVLILLEIETTERFRDYVRNIMLWNTKDGK